MDQETAYKATMAFAVQLRVVADMHKVGEGDWDVILARGGPAELVLHTREQAVREYARLREQAKARA